MGILHVYKTVDGFDYTKIKVHVVMEDGTIHERQLSEHEVFDWHRVTTECIRNMASEYIDGKRGEVTESDV